MRRIYQAMIVCGLLGIGLTGSDRAIAQAPATRWVYRVSDGLWCVHGADDPARIHTQPADYAEVEFPAGAVKPNPRLERADPTSPTQRRAATAAEIASYDAAQLNAEANAKAERAIKALLAVLYKRTNLGQWPDAAAKQALIDEFIVAYKAVP